MILQARAVVSGVLLSGLLAACGGSSGNVTQSTPQPTPTPCTQSTIVQDWGGIPGLTLVYGDFSVPESGRLDITLDWTNASSPLGIYLVPANTCTMDEFNAQRCNFIMRSETMVKPRKTSTNVNAGNYRWLLANFSEADESVSLQVVLSKGTCPGFAAAPAASQASDSVLPPLHSTLRR